MHYYNYDATEIKSKYNFDFVCKHECEKSILRIINHRETIENPEFIDDLDIIPPINLSRDELNSYNNFLKECESNGITDTLSFERKTVPIATSRGCVFDCVFCSSRIFNRKYRVHSLDYIDNQFKMFKDRGVQKITFLDDLLNSSKERINQILDLVEKYELEIDIPNGLRAENVDKNIIAKLKNLTGWIKISAETGNKETMKFIGKNLDLNHVENVAQLCKDFKMRLFVHFIIGFPNEKMSSINDTLKFALRLNKIYDAVPLVQYAVPIKGSRLCNYFDNVPENYMGYFRGGFNPNSHELKKAMASFKISLNKKLAKIIVNTTYECNNNCIFCAVADRKGFKEDYNHQLKLIKEARKKGAEYIDFDGGEPTLSLNFFKLIKAAVKLGYSQINLTTNGRMLSEKENAQKICKSGITSILFSLHGHNSEIHDNITRSRGSFIETVSGIDNVLALKIKNLSVGVNITITKDNVNHLLEFADFLKILGINKVNLQALTPFGSALDGMLPDNNILIDNVSKLISKYDKEIEINLANFVPCFFDGKSDLGFFVQDFLKHERNMAFIGSEEKNLADFLASKRKKMIKCNNCAYDIVCNGEWVFK